MPEPARVQAHTYDDLRRVYLAIAYQPDHPTGLVDRLGLNNSRYARELLGLLQAHGLVESREERDDVLWHAAEAGITTQTHELIFNDTFAPLDAASVSVLQSRNGFTRPDQETSMTETQATAPAKKTAEPIKPHDCGCGCGATLTTKGKYAQGHDARHASKVAQTAAGMKNDDKAVAYIDKQLPTDALRAKARAHAERLRQNEAAKAAAAADKAAAKKAAASKPAKPAATPEATEPADAAGTGAQVTEAHEGSLTLTGDGAVEGADEHPRGAQGSAGDSF